MMSSDGEPRLPAIVEEALSRIQVLLETLFETADDAIVLMDGPRFVDCNPATLRMFRIRTKQDFLGETSIKLSPARQPDGSSSDDKSRQLIAAAIAGVPQHVEWQYRRLDDSLFDVEVSLNRCLVGGAPFLLAVARDITDRKRAQAALLHEKQFSERLIESLPGTFYLYDAQLRLCRWNKNHETQMGYTADELRGKRMEELAASEDHRAQILTAAHRLLQRGELVEVQETLLKHKDGTAVPYLVSGVRIDAPGGPMILGVGQDISARVHAERALAASEHNYRELFNATHDGIFIHDEAGRVLDVNERGCAMFGVELSEAQRSLLVELTPGAPPYSQHDAAERLHRAISEGPQVFDWQSKRLDGTAFWSEIALRAFQIEGEVRVIASVRDITDRKRAGLERERLMGELQAANRAKDEFMAVLSHELRTPLAAIQASIDLLLLLPTLDEPRAMSALRTIERNVKLQTRLVNDLLDMSRLMRGKLTIERAPVRLGEVVLSAAETCRGDATRAEVTIETHAEAGLWVDADAMRIQQMVINLIDNAIKFTPRGGRVTVSVTAHDRHGYVVVEDTGVGIAPDRLSDIFEMFRQGEVAARRAPGLGIGLALVKSIVDLHGCRVWAESPGPGRGSRFVVELPLYEAPPGRTARRTAAGRAVLKLLLVEDNQDTRTMLTETLSQLDYTVLAADSAEVALEILGRQPADVIVADVGLPGMDGYDFLRAARRLPTAARVPAIALTGYGQDSDVRRAREAGYAQHFVKPTDVDVLDEQIRALVGRAAHGGSP
ncbi:MAG TPA: PAS domain S-box protein [Kofleriaceae bacterium]|nr:PAS domain S-box protein [Kofleriaceae bacterium]